MRPSLRLLSTYYQILGVPRHATKKEIKTKFYALSKLHHPDSHASTTSSEKKNAESEFVKISEAYSVLGNAEARKKYDLTLPAERSGDGSVNDPRRAGWSMMERERKRQREWREKVSRQEIWNMRNAQRARTHSPSGHQPPPGYEAPRGTGSPGQSGPGGYGSGGIGTGGTTGLGGAWRQPAWNTSHIHQTPLGRKAKDPLGREGEEGRKPFFETHLAGSFFFVTGTLGGVVMLANVVVPVLGG